MPTLLQQMMERRLKLLHRSKAVKGFTLIELLIYMGLLSLFLTAATTSTWDIILGSVKSAVQQEVQENLRYAAHRLQFEIRNANSINASSDFDVNFASDPSAILSLSAPSPNNPTEFRVVDNVLQVKRGGGGWGALTSSAVEVTNLIFTDLSDSASENAKFIITIRYENPGGRSQWEKEETFEGAAQLR